MQSQRPPRRPSSELLSDKRDYLNVGLPLYTAALNGDWQAAEEILKKRPLLKTESITHYYETALHIASSTKHRNFVEELLKLMEPEDLELQNQEGFTALYVAAQGGSVGIARLILTKNPKLLSLKGIDKVSPLVIAADLGHKDMLLYLYSNSDDVKGDEWNAEQRGRLLYNCVNNCLYDLALKILDHHKEEVALEREYNALHILARKPSEFVGTIETNQAVAIVRIIWGEVVKQEKNTIREIIYGSNSQEWLLAEATKLGNAIFIVEILRLYPELIRELDNRKRNLLHIAVVFRQQSVYNLLINNDSMKYRLTSFIDDYGNNILHAAAMLPKRYDQDASSVAAFKLQSDLLWFKEVQTMVHPSLRNAMNKKCLTPQELFTEQHLHLLNSAEMWMKGTVSQCMVVAALIATVMFAAAFTLPGGNDDKNGHPIYQGRSAFVLFVITDVLSLSASLVAICSFLEILTSSSGQEDFLMLPKKLLAAFLVLYNAITFMMIAFSASFFLNYRPDNWLPILVSGLAVIPAYVMFAQLFRSLFDKVFDLKYNSRFSLKPKNKLFIVLWVKYVIAELAENNSKNRRPSS